MENGEILNYGNKRPSSKCEKVNIALYVLVSISANQLKFLFDITITRRENDI